VAVRAENKQDGMVFAPVWQVLFKEEGRGDEDTSWAEFNAINGNTIDAIFR
jgi:regulatory protein YycI of two-component signal transduction system YycFG